MNNEPQPTQPLWIVTRHNGGPIPPRPDGSPFIVGIFSGCPYTTAGLAAIIRNPVTP